ncbi:MAG: matrixin family metalloprotease [Dehalococcoidia bacterium]|nr:matrixin family metalloprotease [Dehalococcoidia bacterium]
MTEMLRASLADINDALQGALVLVDAGPAQPGAQCVEPPFFDANPYDIVVGWAPLEQGAGLASTSIDHEDRIIGARVVLEPRLPWECSDDPPHRDAQHTMTHELLHALGVDHSQDPDAVMFRSFTVCHAESLLQPDDRDALAALYPVSTSNATQSPSAPSTTSYVGLAVVQMETAAPQLIEELSTEGCMAQVLAVTSEGRWVVYVNGAPAFANAGFPATLAAMSPYFYRCA